jgi:hypothetical protein
VLLLGYTSFEYRTEGFSCADSASVVSVSCLLFMHMQHVWSTFKRTTDLPQKPSKNTSNLCLICLLYATPTCVHHATVIREISFCLFIYLLTYLSGTVISRNPPRGPLHFTVAVPSTDSESSALNYWCPVGCLFRLHTGLHHVTQVVVTRGRKCGTDNVTRHVVTN